MTKVLLYLLPLLIHLISCKSDEFHKVSQDTLVILQPYEGFETEYLEAIESSLVDLYHVKVDQRKPIPIPKEAYTEIKVPRYRADTLIKKLKEKIGKEEYVLGLISEDISVTKYTDYKTKEIKTPVWKYRDWGIFGLGYCPGHSCIVSSHRLLKNCSKEQFIKRIKNVSCHEIGHNFGLPHCPNPKCIMVDAAETIKTVDQVELYLCDECRNKIGLPNN